MHTLALTFLVLVPAQDTAEASRPRDVTRTLEWEGAKRSYNIHIPANCDPAKPAPVVLALHGAGMNAKLMELFCGLNDKADAAGFVVVYPNGTGASANEVMLTWNAGKFPGPLSKKRSDDVGYLAKVLDDLPNACKIDPKRIYATGMSNGAMMTYRLAAELSHRIAAIAPIAGTIMTETWEPKNAMPVLHIHGTADMLVPFAGGQKKGFDFLRFPSVADNMKLCTKANGCKDSPEESLIQATKDEIRVVRKDYGKGKCGAEVICYVLEDAGHVWPGRPIPSLLGKTTYNLIANDVIWEFFQKYRRE